VVVVSTPGGTGGGTGEIPPLPEPDDRVWREMLGAYALGHLTDDDLQQMEIRLAVSPRLRADLEEIRPVAAALPRASRQESAALLAPPPPELEARILTRIAAEPRDGTTTERAVPTAGDELAWARARRQLKRTGIAATAVAAAAAVIFAVTIVRDDGPSGEVRPTKAIQLASASSDVPEAGGSGTLIGFGWGTQIHMTVAGLNPGTRYRVYLESPDGTRIDAGTFQAIANKPVVCEMSGDLLLKDTQTLVIAEAGASAEQPGTVVAKANVSAAPSGTVHS
jgi:hypothetical protein